MLYELGVKPVREEYHEVLQTIKKHSLYADWNGVRLMAKLLNGDIHWQGQEVIKLDGDGEEICVGVERHYCDNDDKSVTLESWYTFVYWYTHNSACIEYSSCSSREDYFHALETVKLMISLFKIRVAAKSDRADLAALDGTRKTYKE